MKNGVISLGEALIDFIPLDETNLTYQKSPGGAPANVAVGVARLGLPSTFLGKVGDDVLGRFLQETLTSYGVNTSELTLTDEARTGAVFVTLAENGERSFDFYIDPSADRFLREEEVKKEIFSNHKILHFGTISMISEPARSATIKAVKLAKENGVVVSFDPNIRLTLWKEKDALKETIIEMIPYADVLKISEEELAFITGMEDIEEGIQALAHYNIPLLIVTLGAEGSHAISQHARVKIDAMKVNAVDTTGAGDAFVSGMLYCVNEFEGNLSDLTEEDLNRFGRFASVSGALAASTKGAMTALPTIEEVNQILNK
ncbi:aminoimidazole riboside kinase [Metabacillus iocasae]|uniref:Fructokinase n=1 Tax=Priestia iocasae TaxID=2291674 RepID=A0ABS2QUI2_9BACI|nr:aminoimidazole riboside kinase [Metabacillus iocasae]MBM7703146.1 fructokinase [Metabacillus iocasae]